LTLIFDGLLMNPVYLDRELEDNELTTLPFGLFTGLDNLEVL